MDIQSNYTYINLWNTIFYHSRKTEKKKEKKKESLKNQMLLFNANLQLILNLIYLDSTSKKKIKSSLYVTN